MHKTHIIIPCFNEANRLPVLEVQSLAQKSGAYLIFVNDGSSDDTHKILQTLVNHLGGRAEVIDLKTNVGKGAAVRIGLRRAIDRGAKILGFVDADMATPGGEICRLIDILSTDDIDAVFGARVALLGSHIKRSFVRHYLGRVFATAASITLNLAIYDTQCGAKFFRNTENLKKSLEAPFSSRWVFDVELIGRLLRLGGPSRLKEIPLHEWTDKGGSHLSVLDMVYAFAALIIIRYRLARYKKT